MRTLEISYDLRAPEKNYEKVIAKIKGLGAWCHALKSCWLVITQLSVNDAYYAIGAVMDKDDLFMIHEFRKPYVGRLTPEVIDWINQYV